MKKIILHKRRSPSLTLSKFYTRIIIQRVLYKNIRYFPNHSMKKETKENNPKSFDSIYLYGK